MEKPSPCKKLVTDNQRKYKKSSSSSSSLLLELPESLLECILERLPPESLFKVAGVCALLRQIIKNGNNQLWETHMKRKWRKLLSPAAYRIWPKFIHTIITNNVDPNIACSSLNLMYFYFALETGKFWFPAQVYYRENWDVTFVLSCYDAELSYNSESDNFQARYPSHGRKAVEVIETGIEWERVRGRHVDISPRQLHESKCLYDLQPGDHIEVQWRRHKAPPYGWWYGVIGHLETCNGSQNGCKCRNNDSLVLEFKQYAVGSRWRRASLNRKSHREAGNRENGYYGGIRKLSTPQEIAVWHRLWPTHILDIQ